MASCFIHQVETHHHTRCNFQDLKDQVQVSFESSRIDDDNRDVWLTEENEVAGGFFVRTSRLQRVLCVLL